MTEKLCRLFSEFNNVFCSLCSQTCNTKIYTHYVNTKTFLKLTFRLQMHDYLIVHIMKMSFTLRILLHTKGLVTRIRGRRRVILDRPVLFQPQTIWWAGFLVHSVKCAVYTSHQFKWIDEYSLRVQFILNNIKCMV